MIYFDTHVVIDLYNGDLKRLSRQTLKAIDDDDELRVSPMVVLELELLHEINRIKISPRRILQTLSSEVGLKVCDAPFANVVQSALEEKWTRDPFDRIILAQARHQRAKLVTRDRQLQTRYALATS